MQNYILFFCGFFILSNLNIYALPLIDLDDIDDVKALLYVEKYKHIAISEMDRTGIPASIKMAQGILESGVGESELALVANNHFGIKCGGDVWSGKTHYVWDDEVVKSCFRVYSSAEESYIAHSEFLMNPKKEFRYGVLFKLDKRDYIGWAKGLQKSGYATSKTYTKNLIAIIERLELYKLDYLTIELLAVNDRELASIFPSLIPKPSFADYDTTTTAIRIRDPFSSSIDSVDVVLTMYIFQVNNIDVVYVQPGDDLNSIADRYRKNPAKLYRFNELKGRELKVGQYVFLNKKGNCYKSSGPQKVSQAHILRIGQSMYDVAQLYGVKLRKLYCYNKGYKHETPKPGVQIFLKRQRRKI
ncbi:glucosaminidase domain-containing protein [Aureispira]|nr:glucosaminidase domain-containing protein [Aureispira sp.]